jgi:uncharacterized protein
MKWFTDSSRDRFFWLRQAVVSLLIGMMTAQLIALPAFATSIIEIPRPAKGDWVVDKAEILSRANEGKISTQLANLADQTGYETHFVTIRRLDYGETAQTFAEKLFKAWFPTAEEQENQTLLVIDNLTNNAAIQTGSKVKAIMSDAIAESIAQETLLVPLKQGNKYNQAFSDAGDRLVAVLSSEPDPGPPEVEDNVMVEGTFATPEETKSSNATVWVVGFLIAATVIPMATYYFYQYMGSR